MSFFTRNADDLVLFHLNKAAVVGNTALKEKRRQAALKAWEKRRRGQAKPPAPVAARGTGTPAQGELFSNAPVKPDKSNRDLQTASSKLKSSIQDPNNPVGSIPWAREKGDRRKGINTSGFVKIGGKTYFVKVSRNDEAQIEEAAWKAAEALGWPDMARPTVAMTQPKGGRRDHSGVTIQPLLPEGLPFEDSNGKVKSSNNKLERMMAFEYAIGAYDRHGYNYWLDNKGEVHGIDYARSFMANPTPMRALRSAGVATRVVDRSIIQHVVDNADKIRNVIPSHGGFDLDRDAAINAFNGRIDSMRNLLTRNPKEGKLAIP